MIFPSNCSVLIALLPPPKFQPIAQHLLKGGDFPQNFLVASISCHEAKALCSFIFALRNLSNEAQKSFAASFIAALLSNVNQVKPLYFQAFAPLLPSSFQPIAQHLLKESDFSRNFSVPSISWSVSNYKASSSFRISLQVICCRNLFQNQSLSVLSSLLCVICQTKV
ncbi:hypothetical protein MRB53_001691 [Persea americana]|uniref:Uncharacterized protein n=1 Tax=Persea americana TaxID=3435 RepID=A0ACC2MSQ7_PERAE|nr:hypothetical protein MRB53_001691 [Persea americana]